MKRFLIVAIAISLSATVANSKSMIAQDCNLLGAKPHSSKAVTKADATPYSSKMKPVKTAPKTKSQSTAHDNTSGACI